MKPREKMFMVVGTVAVMATSGIIGYSLFVPQDVSGNTQAVSSVPTTTAKTTPVAQSVAQSSTTSSSSYKDGTYKGTVSYRVPHGSNDITVTVTVKDGMITTASATHDYSDGESGYYVDSFDASLSSQVDNQSLSSLSVYRIGGASLTTAAFSDVLDTIRNEAKA